MKSLNLKRLTIGLILITIFLLYIFFLFLDLDSIYKGNISNKVKYIPILLCFILSLIIYEDSLNFKDTILLQLGLLFTSLADLFFLLLDLCTLGVATFCIVQIIYCIRYLPKKAYSTIISFATFIAITAIGSIVLSIFSKTIIILFMLAFIYGVCLITRLIRAIKACKEKVFPNPNRYMIVAGMILFTLCDINVCLNYLASSPDLHCFFLNQYQATCSFLIWLFYLPSQLLLALSGYDFGKFFKAILQ